MGPEKKYTAGKAAESLGLVSRTIAKLMRSGDLRGYRKPSINGTGNRMTDENSVLEFLAERGYVFRFETNEDGNTDVVMPYGFLPTGKAAQILGVSPGAVVKYLRRGLLNGYSLPESKIGNCHKVCKESLLQSVVRTGRVHFLEQEQLKELGFYSLPRTSDKTAA